MNISLDDRETLTLDVAALRKRVADLEQQLAASHAVAEHDKASRDTERRAWDQRLGLHIQCTPLAYIEWNLQFEVVEWNPAAELIFGYSKAEALGRHAAGLIVPEEIRAIVDQVWAELLTRTGRVRSNNDNLTKDGRVISCEWYNTPLIAENGSVIGVVSLVQDVTQRKQAEETARLNDECIRALTSNLPVILFAIDTNGMFTLSDGSALKPLGLQPNQIVGLSVHDVYGDRPEILKDVQCALAGGTINSQVAVGGTFFDTWYSPTYTTDGNISGMLGVSIDITERKRAEAALQESQQFVQRITETMPGVICVFDVVQQCNVYINRQASEILGYTPDEAQAKGVEFMSSVLHPDDAPLFKEHFRQVVQLDDNTAMEFDYRIRDAKGSWRWFNSRDTVFARAADGSVTQILGYTQDVTERKLNEQETQRLQDEIIRVQAATVAELSTPLIPISDDIVVMPLIGAIDSQRVQRVLDTLLQGVANTRAHTAIIDITGVSVVDTQVANTLIQAAQAVGLLGARVVLTGIRPEVAQTLVGLGVNLGSIVTRSSLQSGIHYASGRG